MWPIVRRIIERHQTENSPIVMDWWLFNPDLIAEILGPSIKSIWLHIDSATLEHRERMLTDFRSGSTDPDLMHANFMHRSLWRNNLIHDRATELGLVLIHQPGGRGVEELADEALHRLTTS